MPEFASSFEIKKLTSSDINDVAEIVEKYYSRFNYDVYGLKTDSLEDLVKKDIFRAKMKLKQNLSFGMFEKSTGRLIGIQLNTIETHGLEVSSAVMEKYNIKSTPGDEILSRMIKKLTSNMFKDLKTNRIFYPSITAVHSQYRQKGLLCQLAMASALLAKKYGCEYLATVPSSDFLWKALCKGGLSVLNEIKYSEYVDPVTGLKPFASLPSLGFTGARLCYIKLN